MSKNYLAPSAGRRVRHIKIPSGMADAKMIVRSFDFAQDRCDQNDCYMRKNNG